MKRTVYKRCSLTLDLGTIAKCKQLAAEKGQSVSSLVRYLVGEAYDEASGEIARKRAANAH
jgi:hypothetical protein